MFGAFMAIVLLFSLKSCGTAIVDSMENQGRHIVCMEAIEKRVYDQLESCK